MIRHCDTKDLYGRGVLALCTLPSQLTFVVDFCAQWEHGSFCGNNNFAFDENPFRWLRLHGNTVFQAYELKELYRFDMEGCLL